MLCPYCKGAIVETKGRGRRKTTCGKLLCVIERRADNWNNYRNTRKSNIQNLEGELTWTILCSVPKVTDKCYWCGVVGCLEAHIKEAALVELLVETSDYYKSMLWNALKVGKPLEKVLLEVEYNRSGLYSNILTSKRKLNVNAFYNRILKESKRK